MAAERASVAMAGKCGWRATCWQLQRAVHACDVHGSSCASALRLEVCVQPVIAWEAHGAMSTVRQAGGVHYGSESGLAHMHASVHASRAVQCGRARGKPARKKSAW